MSLGDSKPSQLWRKLKQRAGTHLDDEALKVRWLELLPANVSLLLKVVDASDVDKLTETADKLLEVNSNVMAVDSSRSRSPGRTSPAPLPGNNAILQEVAQLRAAVAQLSNLVLSQQRQQHSQQQTRGRSRSRSRSRPAPPGSDGWCWYHQRYQADAKRCTTPCTFQGNA